MAIIDTSTTTVIDRFLEVVQTGRVTPDLYADDARLDATTPGWRFQANGPVQIAAEYQGWFAAPSVLETVERLPFEGGEVVRYLHTFETVSYTHLTLPTNSRV